jgi:hypothetical protein
MKILMMIAMTLSLSLVGALDCRSDTLPDSVYIRMPIDPLMEFTEFSGSASTGSTAQDVTIVWTVGEAIAEFVITGFIPCFTSNVFQFFVEWRETGEMMPFNVHVDSRVETWYELVPVLQLVEGGEWDTSLTQYVTGGNAYFGHYLPPLNMFRLGMYPGAFLCGDIDMTVTMEWGAGVPAGKSSWSAVKGRYR